MKTRPWAGRVGRYVFAALLLLDMGCSPWAHAEGPRTVPMHELLVEPGRFEGQQVRVVGFLQLEFEQNALYQTRDDFNDSVTEHALFLELSNAQLRSSSKLNHGHVIVEGVFRAKDIGHGGMWTGSLKPVMRLNMWRRPRRK